MKFLEVTRLVLVRLLLFSLFLRNCWSRDCSTRDFPDAVETCRQCKECLIMRLIRIRDTKVGNIGTFIRTSQRKCAVLYHQQNRDEEAVACMKIMARYFRAAMTRLANYVESNRDALCGEYGLCNCLVGEKYTAIGDGATNDSPDTTLDDILPSMPPRYVEPLLEAANQNPNKTLICKTCKVVAAEIKPLVPKYSDRKYWINSIRSFCYKSFPDSDVALLGCHWMFKVHANNIFNIIKNDIDNVDKFCEVEAYCEKEKDPPPGFEDYYGAHGGGACAVRNSSSDGVGGEEVAGNVKEETTSTTKSNAMIPRMYSSILLIVLRFSSRIVI